MDYPIDSFTPAEAARLEPHFTNLDEPVFALVNLPETVKGALFARYSRYDGTLRRLFLDEFADSLPESGGDWERDEGKRASELYDTIFLGYGDDSVAQLGGAHVACEWVSNVMTKILQRPRLASYLEQSTRYIRYDGEVPGLQRLDFDTESAARCDQRKVVSESTNRISTYTSYGAATRQRICTVVGSIPAAFYFIASSTNHTFDDMKFKIAFSSDSAIGDQNNVVD